MHRTKQTAALIKDLSKVQIARDWLMVEFADGQNRDAREVWKKAESAGIKRHTFDDARNSLRFLVISHGRNGATWIPPLWPPL